MKAEKSKHKLPKKNPGKQIQTPKKPATGNKYPAWASLGIIVILGILIYSNSFTGAFHFDDLNNIVENAHLRDLSDIKSLWAFSKTRFISYYTFAINYHFGELNVWGYHLVNLLIHLVNACLVWWLTLLIFSSPVMKETSLSKHKTAIAFFTALLFVSHPLATQSVTYIVQRMASLVALFYLLSLALYVKGRLKEKGTSAKYLLFAGAFISGVLAMLTKENAFTLPFAFLLFEICFLQEKKLTIHFKDHRMILLLVAIVLPVMIVLFTFSLSIFKPIPASIDNLYTITSLNYLITQFTVIVKYIQLLFLPIHQNVDYDYAAVNNFFEIPTLLSFLLLAAIIALGLFLFKKHRIISFGIFWFFLTLFIESGIIPIRDLIFEHRTYLPSFGFFLIMSSVIFHLFRDKNKYIPVAILLIVVGMNSFLAYQRNKVWSDPETLLLDVISKSPAKARPNVNLGSVYMDQKQWEKAIDAYTRAIGIDPAYFDAYNNRGAAYTNLGQLDKALADYSQAIRIDPDFVKAYYNRGITYGNMGRWEEAIKDYNKALELESGNPLIYNSRAYAFWQLKQYDQSIEDYSQSIKIDPNASSTHVNRGYVYGLISQWEKAISDYSIALGMDPGNITALDNRSRAYANLGQWQKAIEDFNTMIEIDPKSANAYYNRGFAHENLRQWEKAIADYTKAIEINPNLSVAYSSRDFALSKLRSGK